MTSASLSTLQLEFKKVMPDKGKLAHIKTLIKNEDKSNSKSDEEMSLNRFSTTDIILELQKPKLTHVETPKTQITLKRQQLKILDNLLVDQKVTDRISSDIRPLSR
jgi:DNA primase catalytic subunit